MEQGRDPARYGLLAFGGAGPVHAYGVARILHSPTILSPASAGVASALGFLVAPVAAEGSQSYVARLDRIDWARVNEIYAHLEQAGRSFLAESGIRPAEMSVSRSADMQYLGQMHDIVVPVPVGRLGPDDEPRLRAAFYDRYRDLFQRVVTRIPVEALTWRVTVSAPAPQLNLRRTSAGAPGASARKGERPAFFPERRSYVSTPVYDRYALHPGERLVGPVIVEERESTLVVGPGARLEVDEFGSLVVETPHDARTQTATDRMAEAS
jgi:N-methylhydantoinase A